jgi:GNAT superfamily N-acetyltransferase
MHPWTFHSLPIMYLISAEDPETLDASKLIDLLSDTLSSITGDSGRSSFDPNDVRGPRSLFVVARNAAGQPVGCGALRPLDKHVAEIKRMFAVPGTRGVGSALLEMLEREAVRLGYAETWLETRLVNHRAVGFYESRGYKRIPNFGKYIGRDDAVCFAKKLPTKEDKEGPAK